MLLTSNIVLADVTIDAGTNGYRSIHGLTTLKTSATLEAIAEQRVREIASRWPRWDAGLHAQWIYDAMGCIKWGGENLAFSEVEGNNFAEDWYNSSTHRANMLYPGFDEQGSATYVVDGITFAVQVFKDSCDATGTIGTNTNTGPTAPPTSSQPQAPIPQPTSTSAPVGTSVRKPTPTVAPVTVIPDTRMDE